VKKVPISREEVFRVLSMMSQECRKNIQAEMTAFDGNSASIVYIIFNETKRLGVDHICISQNELGNLSGSSRKIMRSRLLHLARYGIIKVETEWRNDGSNLRMPMKVFPNPVFMALMGIDRLTNSKSAVVRHYVKLGRKRLDYEDDVQGFHVDCAYGSKEPKEGVEGVKAEQNLLNIIAREDNQKAEKEADNALWRQRDEMFVLGCSNLWVHAQSQFGYGQSLPNWLGQIGELSPAAKKERSELTKSYQKYGGRVAALAWYVFAGGVADLADNGQPRFTVIDPHRQFASIDKKPSQFGKHFNAILKDELFLDYAKRKWPKIHDGLFKYFGAALAYPPRYENEYAIIGFEFGV